MKVTTGRYIASLKMPLSGAVAVFLALTGCSKNLAPIELSSTLPDLTPVPTLTVSPGTSLTPSPTPMVTSGLRAPTNLVVSALSPTSVRLTWRDNSNNETDFVVLGARPGNPFVILGVAAPNTQEYFILGLAAGETYGFSIAARNASGVSQSSIVAVRMPFAPPTPPGNVTASAITSTTVDLTWTASTGHLGYRILKAANQDPLTVHATLPPTAVTAQITGLTPDTAYRFQVVAINPSFSAGADPLLVTTKRPAPDAPGSVVAAALSTTAIRLTWAAARNAADYNLYLAVNDGAFALFRTVAANVLSVDVPNLSPATRYRLRVDARNETASTASAVVEATTHWPHPTAPVNFQARATSNNGVSVALSWEPGTWAESYHIYFGAGYNGPLQFRTAVAANARSYDLVLPNPGFFRIVVFTVNPTGNQSAVVFLRTRTRALIDFDGDGKSDDRAVHRPSDSRFLIVTSGTGAAINNQYGRGGHDVPVPGDYDGDGITDIAVFRRSNATWYIRRSRDGIREQQFGAANLDRPVQADYDGDGIDDIAVYRPSTAQWFVIPSTTGVAYTAGPWGSVWHDVPVPADYDGDGRADIAVFRKSNATWYIANTRDGSPRTVQFGFANRDLPVPADYDGDGRADIAVFRADNGQGTAQWHIAGSLGGSTVVNFGARNYDLPVPADYDGDGRADIAVFRRNVGGGVAALFVSGSTAGYYQRNHGAADLDCPLALPLHHGPLSPWLPALGSWLAL